MPKMYVMRRANGELFALTSGLVPVWAGSDTLQLSRARNPELDLFRPFHVTENLKEKFVRWVGARSLWLVEPATNDAPLSEGRRIDWNEFYKLQQQVEAEPPPPPAQKVRATVQEFQFH